MVFEILLDPPPHNLPQKLNFVNKFFKKVNSALENGSVKICKWLVGVGKELVNLI
jgi:hypothetical protein